MMKIRNWLWLVGVLILVTIVACRPVTDDDSLTPTGTIVASVTPAATTVARQATATSQPRPTNTPPPKPTPAPTRRSTANWQQIGGEESGLAISAPPQWHDLSGQLNSSESTNPFGLNVLLLAESERAGQSLLAGKEASTGAFGAGMITNLELPANDPLAALTQTVNSLNEQAAEETAVSTLTQPTLITATTSTGPAIGARIDVAGDPFNFFTTNGANRRSRLLLFLPESGAISQVSNTQALFLLSAPAGKWQDYTPLFEQMVQTIILYDIRPGYTLSDGGANVLGALTERDQVDGNLERGSSDIWTFSLESPRYATITLTPEEETTDLILTLISPSGQTITQVDNGYAGNTESIADTYLTESGQYVVEISEFFAAPARYKLSLALTEEPLFIDTGRIRPGQGIQSELPANTEHVWTFDGIAGHLVSIVLTPGNNQFDAILNFYGPDGQRLVSLDEGFSGDAEVIAGYELPVTGEYTIVVSSFAGSGGPYTLTLDEGGEATLNFYDAGDLDYGDVGEETLRPFEAHAWFFSGRIGDAINVSVKPRSEMLDLDVWLLDPDVSRIAAEDRYGAGQAETIALELPGDGQYLVLVRDFYGESGNYNITLTADPAAVPEFGGILTYGDAVSASLREGQAVVWRFEGRDGERIDISLTPDSPDVDLLLAIQRPDGETVLQVDDTAVNGTESVNDFELTADGQWGVVVREFFAAEGDYTLLVERQR